MAGDNEHTRRARELLQRSEETLERCRNRPHVESSWLEDQREEVPAPVVRKVRTEARRARRTMDQESSKAWNAWAVAIAKRYAEAWGEAAIKAVVPRLKELDDRVAALERKLDRMKQQRWDQPRREDA